MEVLKLSGDERRGYLNFIARLKLLKISMDDAAGEYFGAKKIAGAEDLRDVATLRKKFGNVEVKPIIVPELVEQMATALEQDKRGDYHVRDLRVRLGRFAKDFPGQIAVIKFAMIEKWLRELKSLAKGSRRGGGLKGRSRNNYRNAIGELFNYARKNGYLPKELPTEASGLARVSEEDARENEIFTPKQMVELLNEAHPRLIPSMAIKAFSGVRTEEVASMEWEHVHFKKGQGYIILPKTVTKTKRRRIIPILPNLKKWLAPFEGMTGPICANWSTSQAVFQAWDRHANRLGIRAGGNRFRNSYISYRVAETSDPAKVALESGNSVKVILEDYLELATEEDAARWFQVEPTEAMLKMLMIYATNLKRKLELA